LPIGTRNYAALMPGAERRRPTEEFRQYVAKPRGGSRVAGAMPDWQHCPKAPMLSSSSGIKRMVFMVFSLSVSAPH
jgi:hypothetical protein